MPSARFQRYSISSWEPVRTDSFQRSRQICRSSGCSIACAQKEQAQSLGYTVVDVPTVLTTHFVELMHAHAHELYDGKQLGEVAVSQVVFDMMGIMRRHRVRVNAVFTMVNIAIAVTEGIGRQLDDKLDLMTEALPFFVRLKQTGKL